MKHYKQLTSEQRYQISGLLKAGYKRVEIAIEVGVNKSTISRELKRNRGQRGWRPKQAQAMRDERRRSCVNARQFTPGDWECVEELIRWGFSPEQAAKRLALEGNSRISHTKPSTSGCTQTSARGRAMAAIALSEAIPQALR